MPPRNHTLDILDTAGANVAGDDLVAIQHQYRNIWPAALALNERVQASHSQEGD